MQFSTFRRSLLSQRQTRWITSMRPHAMKLSSTIFMVTDQLFIFYSNIFKDAIKLSNINHLFKLCINSMKVTSVGSNGSGARRHYRRKSWTIFERHLKSKQKSLNLNYGLVAAVIYKFIFRPFCHRSVSVWIGCSGIHWP